MDNDAYLKSGRPCHCRLRAGALLKKGPARLCVPAFFVRCGGAAVVRGAAIAPTAGPAAAAGRAGWRRFVQHSAAGAGHRFCGPAGGGPLPRSRALLPPRSVWNSWAAFWLCCRHCLCCKACWPRFCPFYRDSLPAACRRGRTARWGAADFAAKRTDAGQARSHYLAGAAANRWLVG